MKPKTGADSFLRGIAHREKLGVCSLDMIAMIYFPAMPALIAERLETVRGGVDFGCEVEGGGAAHGSIAATRTAKHVT